MRPALKHGCRSCDTDSPEELATDVTFSAGETAALHLIQTVAAHIGSARSFGESNVSAGLGGSVCLVSCQLG